MALCASLGAKIAYLDLKSEWITLLGKPLRQIRIPSSTPLQVSWCITRKGSTSPGFFVCIGNDAADEGRLGRHQHVDQVVQLVPEVGADGLEVGHLCGRLGLHHHPLFTPAV